MGDLLPEPRLRAVQWYRRASRERRPRETAGVALAAILDELRDVTTAEALRGHYRERDGDWAHGVVARCGLDQSDSAVFRSIEDAAYGLRWLELVHGQRLDLGQSLAP